MGREAVDDVVKAPDPIVDGQTFGFGVVEARRVSRKLTVIVVIVRDLIT